MPNIFIEKIHCVNFRGFRDQKIEGLQKGLNVLIGDNDTGKSTVLMAIDLVLSASQSRVETLGLENLFNWHAVQEFLRKENREFNDLPLMEVDVFLSDFERHEYNGRHFATGDKEGDAYGLCLICRPRDDLFDAIKEVISAETPAFPFEYYSVEFKTFSGAPYSPYNRPLDHVSIDNTKISNDYASRAYVRAMYKANAGEAEQSLHKINYRHTKNKFAAEQFEDLNKKLDGHHQFALRSSAKANLDTDLTISYDDIDIDNLGVGHQCFIRTSFALSKKTNIDVVLLEEPENHLSYPNMKRLIEQIGQATQSQVFVATHSSFVCSRLDLRRAILFSAHGEKQMRLSDIPEDTAEFFIKAPGNPLLEFILSPKSILVEGDAEYMAVDTLFKNETGKDLDEAGVSLISIGGISFPRYLDVAALLGLKVAIITDNDKNPDSDRLKRYEGYASKDRVAIFYDSDKDRSTFEICIYRDNAAICDELFSVGRKTLSVLDYMLQNKSEVAFQLASKKATELVAPAYIKNAIKWVSN